MADAVLVTSSFLPGTGGIESYLAELCEVVAPRLAVLAAGERDGKPLPTDLPYPTAAGPHRMLRASREVRDSILRECERHGTDRVVFGTPFPLGQLGPDLKRSGITYSMILHGAEVTASARIPGTGGRLLRGLSQADLLMTVSDHTAAATAHLLASKNLPLPRFDRLRARVDLQRFRPDIPSQHLRDRYGIPHDAPLVTFLSRIVRRKGADKLALAMPHVAQQVPGAVALIAGEGPDLKRVKRIANKVKAPAVFPGRIPDADVAAFYGMGDVFAFPVGDRWFGLEMEGLGVVLLEASACGTPCVTGASGGTPEAVIDNRTGFVIDAVDRRELIDRLVILLEHRELRDEMGRLAREHVAAEYSKDIPPQALLDWLHEPRRTIEEEGAAVETADAAPHEHRRPNAQR